MSFTSRGICSILARPQCSQSIINRFIRNQLTIKRSLNVNQYESNFKETYKEHIPVSIHFRAVEPEQQHAISMQEISLPFRSNQLQYMEKNSYAQLESEKLESLPEDHHFQLDPNPSMLKQTKNAKLIDILLDPDLESKSTQILSKHLNFTLIEATHYFRYLFYNVKRTYAIGLMGADAFCYELDQLIMSLKRAFTVEEIRCNHAFILYNSDLINFRINFLQSFGFERIDPLYVLRFETLFNLNEHLLKKFAVFDSDFDPLEALLAQIEQMSEAEKDEFFRKRIRNRQQMSMIKLQTAVVTNFLKWKYNQTPEKTFRSAINSKRPLNNVLAIVDIFDRYSPQRRQNLTKSSAYLLSVDGERINRFVSKYPVFDDICTLQLLLNYPRTILDFNEHERIRQLIFNRFEMNEINLIDYFGIFSFRTEMIEKRCRYWCDLFGKSCLEDRKSLLKLITDHHTAQSLLKKLLASFSSNGENKVGLFKELISRLPSRPKYIFTRKYEEKSVCEIAFKLNVCSSSIYDRLQQIDGEELLVDSNTVHLVDILLKNNIKPEVILDKFFIVRCTEDQLDFILEETNNSDDLIDRLVQMCSTGAVS